MKPKPIDTLLISALASIGIFCIGCQKNTDGTSVEEAAATEISNHLDLEVVISLFGESENLEDFENKLNEPERQISNLDLNEDGEVDYLRVVESSMDETHLVSVQTVIGEDQYQDVATFDFERDELHPLTPPDRRPESGGRKRNFLGSCNHSTAGGSASHEEASSLKLFLFLSNPRASLGIKAMR